MVEPPRPEPWRQLINQLEQLDRAAPPISEPRQSPQPRTIYVLGAPDTGKSTLCHQLAAHLAGHAPTAQLDADPGQSTLGPPTTLGLAWVEPGAPASPAALRFVGSTTPAGHFLQTLVGAKRLAERATDAGSRWLVIDSPGLVAGDTGREFQHEMIELLGPDWLVMLGGADALEPIVSVFEARGRPRVHRLEVSEAVRARTTAERAAYRAARFREYFEHAESCVLDLAGRGLHGHLPDRQQPEEAAGRVVALCDREGWVLVLGVVERADWTDGRLHLHVPPFDDSAVASVQFGTHQL